MRRNCNLELRLFPLSASDLRPMMETTAEGSETPSVQQRNNDQQQQQYQPLTIFYDGKICVSDVTELQARSILMQANKEIMEERIMRTPTPTPTPRGSLLGSSEPSSPMVQSNLYSPGTALSMKKSLQRFLQKRKNRVQEASPYQHH